MLRTYIFILLLFSLVLPLRAKLVVGVTAETTRVLRKAVPPPFQPLQLHAARNEWVSFQILLRSDLPVTRITVDPGNLWGPNGAVISAESGQLYREHQLELTSHSYRCDDMPLGWYPDALIPLKHPLTGKLLTGARLQAMPFDLPANETHGFWVDIFVPSNVPAGIYRGAYTITAFGTAPVVIPVTLEVWNFTLPDTPTLKTALGATAAVMSNYYLNREKQGKGAAPKDWTFLYDECNTLLAQHRINAWPATSFVPREQTDKSWLVPVKDIDAFREFVDRYQLNAYQVSHPKYYFPDPVKDKDKLLAWMKALNGGITALKRPQVTFYIYLQDEPNSKEEYANVQLWGKLLHEVKTQVQLLVVEQPQTQDPAWGDLYGAVDIWCPLFSIYEEAPARARQELGETIWSYTALAQRNPTPWWLLDCPLLNYRAPAWIAWRFRERGLLYWGGMAHWDIDDPWTDPKTYTTKGAKPLVYNGEGSLLYPGNAVGFDGVAPSMRLKALRDAIEDYEYLSILERAGKATEAEEIVLPLANSWFSWEKDPAVYERARVALAALIATVE